MVDCVVNIFLLLFCMLSISVVAYPRDEFRVTATAMLTNIIHRREVELKPTLPTHVHRHKRRRSKIEVYLFKKKRSLKNSLPLENPHPIEEEPFQPKLKSRRVNIAPASGNIHKKQVAQSEPDSNVSDSSDDGNFDPDDTSEITDMKDFQHSDDEDEDDEDEASPTAAGFTEDSDADPPSSSNDSSNEKDSIQSSSPSLSSSSASSDNNKTPLATSTEKNDETPEEHYDFTDDEDDIAEEPDEDASSPTDAPSRKEKIHPTLKSSKSGNRKTEIEKNDSELDKLLQLESDIDEMTKNIPKMRRSNM